MPQLFLSDLDIDDIERNLPGHRGDLAETLAALAIDIDAERAMELLPAFVGWKSRKNGRPTIFTDRWYE